MTLHIRTQIRHALVDQLKDKTSAGDRVFAARLVVNPEGDTPAIFVSAIRETSSRADSGGLLERFPEVRITAIIEAQSEAADDEADALALEIEQAIAADETLSGTAFDLSLEETEIQFEQGTRPLAMLELTYRVEASDFALPEISEEE